MEQVSKWLKEHWLLVGLFFTAATAYGQAQTKIQSLEDAVKQNVIINSQINEIKLNSVRQEEQLKSLDITMRRQEKMMEIMLERQDKVYQRVTTTKKPTLRPLE